MTLYAHSPSAFHGLHQALAQLCDAWAPGAVSNADLTFTTRLDAQRAPVTLRDDDTFATACGYMAERDDTTPDAARLVLLSAATLAGVDPIRLAELVLQPDHDDVDPLDGRLGRG